MRFAAPPLEGRFLRRYKRFFADVDVDGEVVTAHCPNTGSLLGCLTEGSRVWLRDSGNPRRKLRYTWQAVRVGRTWVNVDTSLPNAVVCEAVEAGAVPELAGYDACRREVPYGRASRIDLLLSRADAPPCWIEVKSTTLVDGTTGLFPDAVTERGRKHLEELARVVESGGRAVQLFFVNRADVDLFRPADTIDPAYGAALRHAAAAGVEVLAYRTLVRPRSLALGERVSVDLAAHPWQNDGVSRGTRAPRRQELRGSR
jgi:sugar fermentation stimulation protein A